MTTTTGSKKKAIAPRVTTAVVEGGDVSERQIDRWVADLKQLVVGGQVELMARVGEYLLSRVYGSVEEALSRRSGKHASLRRLAERAEEFGMRAATLSRAVPIALQVRQLGKPIAMRLGIEHHRALLPVRDAGEKKNLAEAAVDARWTAVELRKKVRRVKRPHPGGRTPEPPLRVFVRRIERQFQDAEPERFRDAQDQIGADEARKLLATVNRAQSLLERIEKQLTRAATRPQK